MNNTTITIKNQHGEYSVTAPIGITAYEYLELFMSAMYLASFEVETIESAILEKADRLNNKSNKFVTKKDLLNEQSRKHTQRER